MAHTEARGSGGHLEYRGRSVRIRSCPISIDVAGFDELARDPEVQQEARRIREQVDDRQIVLGIDRLDYTKGIDARIKAFETLLARYDDLAAEVVFVQIAVPSREMVPEYARIRTHIEQHVGRVNGDWGRPGLVPVHYLYRSFDRRELVAWYQAADVMAVTPLRDGMNLVAKEYVAARADGRGVLLLSEFAGAAEELRDAILVNPHDVDGMASALERSLDLPEDEMRERMTKMRAQVERNDVRLWASGFLGMLAS